MSATGTAALAITPTPAPVATPTTATATTGTAASTSIVPVVASSTTPIPAATVSAPVTPTTVVPKKDTKTNDWNSPEYEDDGENENEDEDGEGEQDGEYEGEGENDAEDAVDNNVQVPYETRYSGHHGPNDTHAIYFVRTDVNKNFTRSKFMKVLSKFSTEAKTDILFARHVYTKVPDSNSSDSQKTRKRTSNFLVLLTTSFGDNLFAFKESQWGTSGIYKCIPFMIDSKHLCFTDNNGKYTNNPYILFVSAVPTNAYIHPETIARVMIKRMAEFRHLFHEKQIKGYTAEPYRVRILNNPNQANSSTVFIDFNPYTVEDVLNTVVKCRQLLCDSDWEDKSDSDNCTRMTCIFGKLGDQNNSPLKRQTVIRCLMF